MLDQTEIAPDTGGMKSVANIPAITAISMSRRGLRRAVNDAKWTTIDVDLSLRV
jgi:hypothetical protein